MGLYASFDVIGDFGYIAATEEWGIEPDYGPGCSTFVSTFMSSAQGSCPVDTGYLCSTISANTDGHSFCDCQATAEYAQYVEYGTWKMGAQAYFTPALEAAIAAAGPLWTQAEEEAIKEDERLTEEEEKRKAEAAARANEDGQDAASEFAQMAGSIVGALLVGLAITFVQAATGHDFREQDDSSHRGREGGGGAAFVPAVIIT